MTETQKDYIKEKIALRMAEAKDRISDDELDLYIELEAVKAIEQAKMRDGEYMCIVSEGLEEARQTALQ